MEKKSRQVRRAEERAQLKKILPKKERKILSRIHGKMKKEIIEEIFKRAKLGMK